MEAQERGSLNSSPVDLVGNALCLDFVNTVNRRPSPDRDLLRSAQGLRTWLEAAGFDDSEVSDASAATLILLRELRENLYDVFVSASTGMRLPPVAVAAVVSRYATGLPHAGWRRTENRFTAEWTLIKPADIADVVTASAIHLLQAGPLDRVGQCPACGWLFLDTSRNGRRRWCSMDICGSREKSARYFDRSKGRTIRL